MKSSHFLALSSSVSLVDILMISWFVATQLVLIGISSVDKLGTAHFISQVENWSLLCFLLMSLYLKSWKPNSGVK